MNELDKKIIKEIARCNLNVKKAAENMLYCRNTFLYHIKNVKAETGLDARCFYDMCELIKIIESGESQ